MGVAVLTVNVTWLSLLAFVVPYSVLACSHAGIPVSVHICCLPPLLTMLAVTLLLVSTCCVTLRASSSHTSSLRLTKALQTAGTEKLPFTSLTERTVKFSVQPSIVAAFSLMSMTILLSDAV